MLLLLSAISPACGVPPDDFLNVTYDSCSPLVIVPPEDATEAERSSLDAAVASWNALGVTRLRSGEELASGRVPLVFRSTPLAHYGLYDDETGTVIVNRTLTADRPRAITIAHEAPSCVVPSR